jgi:hypothetical protein
MVWEFITSEANDVNWRAPWLRSVRRLSEGVVGVGTRYESVYRFFGRDDAVVVELTEITAPGRLAWRQHDGGHTDAPNWKYFIPWADKFLPHASAAGHL